MTPQMDCPLFGGQKPNSTSQFKYFYRAFQPIVNPANNEFALIGVVAVFNKILAAILEFNAYVLPFMAA